MSNLDVVGGKFTSDKPYLFRALYEWIIDNEGTPYLLVDATKANVQVPRHLVKDGQIVLNASPNAIRDWFTDNSAISFNTRFSGKAENIYIPMKALLAIYAQENGLGTAFPEELGEGGAENKAAREDPIERKKQIELDLLTEIAEEQDRQTDKDEKKPSKKVSHLKVIK